MFIESPGDFLFFLVVMILNLISLLMSLRLVTNETNAYQRYTFALGGIVFAWSLMFAGVLFIRITEQDAGTILPPLERAVTTASILLFAWAFLTADHARWRRQSNTLVLLLLLVIAVAYAVTGVFWIDFAGQVDFNFSVAGLSWIYALIALPIFGILFTTMLFRDVVDAPLKIVYFLLVVLGGVGTIVVMQEGIFGNDLGIYRLAFTLAQILVPILVYRVVVNQYEYQLEEQSIRGSTPIPPPPRPAPRPEPPAPKISQSDTINAQLLKAMGMILETGQPDDIPAHIVSTLLDILRADVGALIKLNNYDFGDISVAQDRMMGKKIASKSLSLDRQPTLVNAIERRAQRGLYPDRNTAELDDLYERMYIEQRGPAYLQPLTHNSEVFAVILVAMPYTKRELKAEQVELLKGLGVIAGSLLAVSYAAKEATQYAEDRTIQAIAEGIAPSALQEYDVLEARKNIYEDLANARLQISQLTEQVSQLNLDLTQERERLLSLLGNTPEDLSISQRIQAITEEQLQLRDERDDLTRRYSEAQAAMNSATDVYDDAGMKNLVETLRREVEILEAEKIRLQQGLEAMQVQDGSTVPNDMQRLINRMIEEKNALEQDRDQLTQKLSRVRSQLQSLNIEDDMTGMSQLIATLGDERKSLRQQNELLQHERDTLLRERQSVKSKIDAEKARDQQLDDLRTQMEKLATDREIALRQRNKAIQNLNNVKEHRARLVAEVGGYEIELNEVREEQEKLRAQVQELADARNQLVNERDRLIAENTTTTAELEQALSQGGGDGTQIKSSNDEAVTILQAQIDKISEQRDALDRQLRQAQLRVTDLETQLEVQQVATMAANGSADLRYEPNKPELLVGLVQELRTPLTTISGFVDLLLSEAAGMLGERQRRFLNSVGANISRLESMVNSLIHVTRLDTGKYELDPYPVDIVQLVEEAITNASVQFRQKGLAVTLDIDEGIPPIPADEEALREVIGQLLSNAYLISPPDGDIHVTVVRRAVQYDNDLSSRPSVYIDIEDSGGGINSQDINRVFEANYRADSPLIQGLGDTGVGMSIAKALVEAHDGKLWVQTKEGIGSIFSVAIPLDLELIEKED